MALHLAILTGALLCGGAGFGTLVYGMESRILGEMPKAKCVVFSVIGTAIIIGTVAVTALLLKY